MSEFEVAKKHLKNDMIVLFILELIILIYSIISKNFNLFSLVFAVFLFAGYLCAKKGTKTAGTIGTIVGILMILTIFTGDMVDFLLGLFVLKHSSKYSQLF